MHMRSILSVILIPGSLMLASCGSPGPDPQVAQLEKKMAALQLELDQANTRFEGEVLKLQSIAKMHDFDGDPLKDFFNAPEFWENTYDSGNSDCCKRCSDAAKEHRAACADETDPDKRAACYAEAASQVASCVDGCSSRFPPAQPGQPHP